MVVAEPWIGRRNVERGDRALGLSLFWLRAQLYSAALYLLGGLTVRELAIPVHTAFPSKLCSVVNS